MKSKVKAPVKNLKKGLIGAVSGIILGFVLMTAVNFLVNNGNLPDYSVWLLGLFNFVANLFSLKYFRSAGLLYTIGWLAGSWLFIGMLGPVDIIFNIAGPIAIMVLRLTFWIKRTVSA